MTVDGGAVRCEQEVAGGRDVYELPLPAVVTVQGRPQLPALPLRPGRSARSASRSTANTPERPRSRLEKLRLLVPEGEGKQAEVLGHGPDAAPRVVEVLQQIGVV